MPASTIEDNRVEAGHAQQFGQVGQLLAGIAHHQRQSVLAGSGKSSSRCFRELAHPRQTRRPGRVA